MTDAALGFDYLIVGAGFAGSVLAERLAAEGKRVLIVDKRPHIGGNAYDRYDDAGILIHPYGPHIFHTNSREVFEYLSRFTEWRPYQHRVLASVDGQLLPIPINLDTINQLYGLNLTTLSGRGVLRLGGRAGRAGAHQRRRGGQQGRARPLREVLPGLHPQAVGAGPVRARRLGDGPGADPHQPRRPLLHRHLPGDAAARLHPDVRGDAGPPQHQGDAQHRLPRDCCERAVRPPDLHRPGGRLLRLPVRQAALPQPGISPRNARRRRNFQPVGDRQLSRTTTPIPASASSSTSPGRARPDQRGLRITPRRGRSVLPGAAPGKRRCSTKNTRRWPRRRRT